VPEPSTHLFVAAGPAQAPLPPILVVFGSVRFVSYVLWVSAGTVVDRTLRETLGSRLGGWGAVALQLDEFALIFLLMRVEWRRILHARGPATSEQTRPLDDQEMGDCHRDDLSA
jgi:hypothetical protein